jgi:hypothetical protein
MHATFRLNADELGAPLLEKIRSMFAHQQIRISIEPVEEGILRNGDPTAPGVPVKNLVEVLDSLPHLSKENADAFAKDLEEIRRIGNAPLPPNPWDL